MQSFILSQVVQAFDNKSSVSRTAERLVTSLDKVGYYESQMGVDFGAVIGQCAAGLNTETAVFAAKVMVKFFALRVIRNPIN